MPWMAAAAMGGSVASGLIGAASSAADRKQALDAYQQSVNDYQAIGVPPEQAMQLVLQDYKQQGKLTPELEQAISQGPSAMEGVSTDPQYKEAQLNALSSLKDIADRGGTSLQDRANLEKKMGNLASDERGSREAILARSRERGQMGSGLELASQLENQQRGSQQAHADTLQSQADAEQRALQAISMGGNMGGNLRSEDFGEQSSIAAAKDRINQFNTQNSQAVQQRNVAAKNAAQGYNLSEAQRVADQNTGIANTQEQYNKQLPQQNFNNQLTLAGGKANARAGQATQLNNNANATSNTWAGIGSGVNKAGIAAANYASRPNTMQTQQLPARKQDDEEDL